MLQEAVALARELGARSQVGLVLEHLGAILLNEGDLATARDMVAQSVAMSRELGGSFAIVTGLARLARVERAAGNLDQACALYHECLEHLRETTRPRLIPGPLESAGAFIGALGQLLSAAKLFGAAVALREGTRMPRPPCDQAEYDQAVLAARAAAGRKAFESAFSYGASFSLEQAIACGLEALSTLQVQLAQPTRQPQGTRHKTVKSVHETREHELSNPLTIREREVTALLAQGRTNREIAESLVIAPSTAKRHVATILAKLGVRSRAGVALWVVQHGLPNLAGVGADRVQ